MTPHRYREGDAYRLDDDALAHFHREGFVVLEGLLGDDLIAALKPEIDDFERHRGDADGQPPIAWPGLGMLTSHPATMALVGQLMGPGFAYHHLHCARHDPGTPDRAWHQDYEQIPQTNRSHLMVHVFYYLNGLDGCIGDLLVLPRSQGLIMGNGTPGVFGTADLPGSLTIDDLAPGTAVIVHSALLHARRAKPGGEGHPRYFVDCSYCQAGIRWPSTYNGRGTWRDKLRLARERGLDRDGRYAHLFDEAHFFDSAEAHRALAAHATGSLVEHLPTAVASGGAA